jgi:hypothetical protein
VRAGQESAEAIVVKRVGESWLRGLFLAATGGDETRIDASFCATIRIAKEQKSISLAARRRSKLRRIPPPKSNGYRAVNRLVAHERGARTQHRRTSF